MPRYILETAAPLTDEQRADLAMDHGGTCKPQARTLHIIGRRWFQKTYGNTYHTAQIVIDGQTVHRSGKAYGYGDQFLTTAHDWLVRAGYLPPLAPGEGFLGDTRYLRESSGFAFTYECHDVNRQKDL